MAVKHRQILTDHAVTKINVRRARERNLAKSKREQELNERMKAMATDIKAGIIAPSGSDLYNLHPCAYISNYGPTNNKQTKNQRALRPRDFRFPEGHPLHPKYTISEASLKEMKIKAQKRIEKKASKLKKSNKLKKSSSRVKKEKLWYVIRSKVRAKKTAAFQAKKMQSTGN
jgi:hypothetical protein